MATRSMEFLDFNVKSLIIANIPRIIIELSAIGTRKISGLYFLEPDLMVK